MAKHKLDETVTLENVSLLFRNFTGEEKQFNPAGQRNFCIVLPPNIAESMQKDGWNVKQAKPREDGDEPPFYIQAKLGYGGKGRPPRVVIITSRGRNTLSQSQVSMLDWADIEVCDVIIRPYNWEQPNGSSGVTAYVQTMYVTIREDDLERKYAEIPDVDNEPDDGPSWED